MNRYYLLVLLLLFPQCGKKRRNFFTYNQTSRSSKINKLNFPTVKGVWIEKFQNKNRITWFSIKHENLIGYNVYHFSKNKFIRKQPVNKHIITKTIFVDKSKHTACYVIRGIFKINNILIEGPASQIVEK